MLNLKKKIEERQHQGPVAAFRASQLYLQHIATDLNALELPKGCRLISCLPNMTEFEILVQPQEGIWRGGEFKFKFTIPPDYRYSPPKVHCETQIWHPNIDTQGNICLNILREDWSPIHNVQSIVFGLLLLFAQPNISDPLNHVAAEQMQEDQVAFAQRVRRTFAGDYVDGIRYPRMPGF